ncbi:DUF222 domain-containing protein [Microbacterium sp. P05]|uniref:HNH endonuclease signature motif containing protein n=1 Tax=Microbacterium sp. P05 TaxID=3366948 RepID=UPI003745D16E
MDFFTGIEQHTALLRSLVGDGVEAREIPRRVVDVCDADIKSIMCEATALMEAAGSLRTAAAGVLAARSLREQGHGGMAAGEGHRNAASLVQELTGTSKAEAARQLKLGEALLDGAGFGSPSPSSSPDAAPEADAAGPVREPWHATLGRSRLEGRLTSAQHDAIFRGLGQPPTTGDPDGDEQFVDAWALAAEQLTHEAPHRTVEELTSCARTIRDRLDPAGAAVRFDERFARRSFRMWVDADGLNRASVVLDDERAAWLRGVFDSALRPRRGGPTFVDAEEKRLADELAKDPRTNDQLAYDLFMDILRAGTLADAKSVLGTRQAGLRIVITADARADALDGEPAIAHTEDGVQALPAWLALQRGCESSSRTIWTDDGGEPLRLGREERTFTGAQRITLAVRDGGCRAPTCDRPASMCEAHHIDPWSEGGTTDVDRGILLCRFHHMQLHHGGSRITREGLGDFILHPPPGKGEPQVLTRRLGLSYGWAGIAPPPKLFRLVA